MYCLFNDPCKAYFGTVRIFSRVSLSSARQKQSKLKLRCFLKVISRKCFSGDVARKRSSKAIARVLNICFPDGRDPTTWFRICLTTSFRSSLSRHIYLRPVLHFRLDIRDTTQIENNHQVAFSCPLERRVKRFVLFLEMLNLVVARSRS
jgi:hypothetical protein